MLDQDGVFVHSFVSIPTQWLDSSAGVADGVTGGVAVSWCILLLIKSTIICHYRYKRGNEEHAILNVVGRKKGVVV